MKQGITIIIPVYNEAENLPDLFAALDQQLADKNEIPVEILFVNDGSADASSRILQKQAFGKYPVRLINLSKNYGSHAALRAGILHVRTEFVVFLYADLQVPPELIWQLYEKVKEGFDIVWASRAVTGHSFIGALFSGTYVKLIQKFVQPDFPDNGIDIMLFNSKVTQQLNQNIESNSSLFLQVLSLGFSQAHITFNRKERAAGKSKWSFSNKVKLLVDSFVAFSYAPIRFVTIMGMLLFVTGVVWTVYITSRKLIYDDLLSGWPMLTSILLLGFGITNIALGIIAEYLWRTLDATRSRPAFIVNEIIELQAE